MATANRIASLDGLRGLAASLVVLSHLGAFLEPQHRWVALPVGDEAVGLFFALSGFLMAFLYGAKPFDPAGYLLHRFARIYPVYLAAVLFVMVLSQLAGEDYPHPITGIVEFGRHILMLGSTGVFWSIPPEIQFYFYFLLLWLWWGDPKRFQWVPLLSLAGLIVLSYLKFPGPGILLPSKFPYFVFGVIAGRLHVVDKQRWHPGLSGGLCLSLLTLFLLFRVTVAPDAVFWGVETALCASAIVYFAALGSPVSGLLLTSRPLRFLGKISFSLYLFHFPVIYLSMKAFAAVLPNPIAVCLSVCLAVLFSFVSFSLVEDPCRKVLVHGRKWTASGFDGLRRRA